jgi:hypothetical protein
MKDPTIIEENANGNVLSLNALSQAATLLSINKNN